MKCSKCKAKLKKDMRYCPICGTKVVRRSKQWITVLLVISLLVGTAFGGWVIGISLAKRTLGSSEKLDNVKISSAEDAITFSKELGKELGYENALSELTEKVTTTVNGDSYYRLQQNYQGIPVYGKTIVCATDIDGNVTSVTGNTSDVEDKIDLTPSITTDQAMQSINSYMVLELGYPSGNHLVHGEKYNLCVFFAEDDTRARLAYQVETETMKFIVDAQDGTILASYEKQQDVVAYSSTDTARSIGYTVELDDEGNYVMSDPDKKISVWDLHGKYSKKASSFSESTAISSEDDIFGNSDREKGYGQALELFSNIGKISQFFSTVCNFSYEEIFVFINDGYDFGLNASGGIFAINPETGGYVGQIAVGNAIDYNDLEVLCHEYGHVMSFKLVDWAGGGVESRAISEGLSDILGELYVATLNGRTDWYMDVNYRSESSIIENTINAVFADARNIANPADTGNALSMSEYSPKKGGYYNSTIVSHSAYLMWNGINGNASKKITAQDLINLWYRAMLMMPSDCNFVECRTLVELAASSMKLTDSQKQCVSEAFDAVGIVNIENTVVDYELAPYCKLQVIGKDDKPYDNYTVTVSYYSMVGSYAKDQPLFVYHPQYNIEPTKVTTTKPFSLPSEEGIYKVSISDNLAPSKEIVFSICINSEYIKNSLAVYTNFEKPLVVNITDSTNSDAYNTYRDAMRITTASGKWTESMNLTANMAVTDGNTKTKTKMTMTSDTDISNYSESDPYRVNMSGTAEMTVMGQVYAWNMQYENGMAHYQYTRPNQTSADIAIDPSFFNFSTITSDMMTKAKMSGNQITFTVPGDKITEVGIAAVNQMSGVDDLKYGDVDVTVTISNEGTIDTIMMVFHASLKYQGYDADVNYDIAYHFSKTSTISNIPSVSIVPCSYTNQEDKYDILTVHEVNGNQIVFSVWWYRIWDISNATATLSGNVASFDYYDANYSKEQVKGTIEFSNGQAILTISEGSNSYIHQEPYHFNFLAEKLNDQQLKEISRFLGVPDDLDVTIKQGTPYYWEGAGIYCTEVGIYYNGELIAGADVDSLTGGVAGGIYMYSGHT